MASSTFRSDSSSSTNLTVNIYEIWRSGTRVGLRCAWSVTTGSATSLGSSSNRTLYLKNSGGGVVAAAVIKSGITWSSSSTYSGSFDFEVDVGTWNAGSIALTPSTSSEGTQSCIWTDYVSALNVAYSLTWSNAGAPTSPRVMVSPFQNSVELRWEHGADGVNNAISTYHLYYRINGGAETGVDVGKVNSYTLNTAGLAPGDTVDFHIATIAPHNVAWSGWSNVGRKNRAPYAPTSATVPQTTYLPGDIVVVSFANNGDPDGNNAGFEVATDQNETIVGSVANGSATSVSVNTTGWQQGITRKFRVRSYDAYGIRSGWSNYTAMVRFNTPPNIPAINFPASGKTVYNSRPRILVIVGAANDGPENVLGILQPDEKTTAGHGSLFSCGTQVFLETGRKVVYKPGTDYGASPTVGARMFDGYLYSDTATRSFNVATFAPTDPDITISGMKIKAVHITDLQTAVNNLRAAYGLAAASFTTVTAGVTGIGNASIITELQNALQAVISLINGWDVNSSTFDITVTWINPAATGGGVDRVKLRQAIEQLRSLVTQI